MYDDFGSGMGEEPVYEKADKIAACKSCGAEIVWMKTQRGKNICVDVPEPDDPLRDEVMAAEVFDRNRFKTHFETCPQADQHRRRGSSAPQSNSDPGIGAGALAKKLNTALAALQDIAKNPPDGLRSVEIAKAAVSQVAKIR